MHTLIEFFIFIIALGKCATNKFYCVLLKIISEMNLHYIKWQAQRILCIDGGKSENARIKIIGTFASTTYFYS